MPVAPLIASFQRWLANLPGPLQGASQLTGVPILTDVLGAGARAVVEAGFGAVLTNDPDTWPWTDITADVRQADGNAVVIAPIGRQDESTVSSPAGVAFQLDNPTGAYSAFNPLGPNWPNVVRNTPIRVRITLDGGANWYVRFQGYANSFTPAWDTTTNLSIVLVSASGSIRRLAQGASPLRSALERSISAETAVPLLGYWPGEDGVETSKLASGVVGDLPGTMSSLDTSTNSDLVGSAPLPVWTATSTLKAAVPRTQVGGNWQVEWHYFLPSGLAADTVVMQINATGTIAKWQLIVLAGGTTYSILGYDSTGTLTINRSFATVSTNPISGAWVRFFLYAQQSGGNVNWQFILIPSLGTDGAADGGTYAGTVGTPTYVRIPPAAGLAGFSVGHIQVYDAYFYTASGIAARGHVGETPADRMTRLCDEEGVPFEVVGFYATDTTMGPQSLDTLLNLLRECETADAGFLYDGLTAGLQYQGISQRYDQSIGLTLSAAAGDLVDVTPVDDDQRNRNKVKVSRLNGSSATAEDTSGPLGTAAVGVYDSELTVNTEDDTRNAFRAQWDVHAGTVQGLRYPTLNLNLAASATLATRWLNRTDGFTGPVPPGSRIDVTGISGVATQHPAGTLYQMLEGYTETISPTAWTVTCNCINNTVYDVFKISDSQLGRLQTAGATLTADAPAGATALTVATPGVVWTTTATYPNDFPMYVEIAGVQVTVTAISGSSSPQTFTVTGATVTKALHAGDTVKVWHTGVIKY